MKHTKTPIWVCKDGHSYDVPPSDMTCRFFVDQHVIPHRVLCKESLNEYIPKSNHDELSRILTTIKDAGPLLPDMSTAELRLIIHNVKDIARKAIAAAERKE